MLVFLMFKILFWIGKIVCVNWECFCLVDLLVEFFLIMNNLLILGFLLLLFVNLFGKLLIFKLFFFCVIFCVCLVVIWVLDVSNFLLIILWVIFGFFIKYLLKCFENNWLIVVWVLELLSFVFVWFLNWGFGCLMLIIVVIFLWIFLLDRFVLFFFNKLFLWV